MSKAAGTGFVQKEAKRKPSSLESLARSQENAKAATDDQEKLIMGILSSAGVIRGKAKFVKMVRIICRLIKNGYQVPPFGIKSDRLESSPNLIRSALQRLQDKNMVVINHEGGRQDIALADQGAGVDDFGQRSAKMHLMIKRLNAITTDDMETRIFMMESMGLDELPEIDPGMISKSTGLLRKYKMFGNMDVDKMIEDVRGRRYGRTS